MDLSRELQHCQQLASEGKATMAKSRLRKLIARAKTSKQLHIMIAAAEQSLGIYDVEYAIRVFHKALSLTKEDKGEAALSIGYCLVRHSRYREAADILETAEHELPEDDFRPTLLLADAYERLHELDRVKELVDKVKKYHPNSIPAHRLAASVARQEGRLDDALRQLEAMDAKSIPMHWEASRAWYEKGHIHDKAGEYEKAIKAWQIAKQYYLNDGNYSLFQKQAEFIIHHPDRVFDSLTADRLDEWRAMSGAYSRTERLTILAGHPRSGTTLLEQALDAHPDAVSAEETSIFSATIHGPIFEGKPAGVPQSDLLDGIPRSKLIKYRRGYRTLIDLALEEESNGRMIIDKNPDLLQLLPTVIRVLPEARILMALRDPRDILISIFSQPLPPNHNAICHLSLESSAKFVAKRLGLWIKLRDIAPDIACVLKYEDLVHHFQDEVKRALDYMGLPWDSRCADPSQRANQRVVQSPTYAAVREPVHSKAIGRWKNYEQWIEPHLSEIESTLQGLGYS